MIDAFPPERIARLRKILAKHNPPAVSCVMENIPAALDEIERLTAERDSLIDQVRAMSGVSATLSRVTAERDEAVGLMKPFAEVPGWPNPQAKILLIETIGAFHLFQADFDRCRAFIASMEGRKDA